MVTKVEKSVYIAQGQILNACITMDNQQPSPDEGKVQRLSYME